MSATTLSALAICALCLTLAPVAPARAQLLDLLKNLPTAPAGKSVAPHPNKASTSAAMLDDAPPVAARAGIEAELKPDADCSRPREKFDVAEKLAEYGGTAAALRLTRLVETDFAYHDLTEQDRQLLRYIAKTTVWLPVEVENRLAGTTDTLGKLFGQGPKLTELDEEALKQIGTRLALLQAQASDFPGEIRLEVDDKVASGAFARFGSVIVVSRSFLNGLTQDTAGADFVLAHELSHVYKRHAIKDLQFKLISSREGWDLSRKVLQRAQRGMQVNPLADGIFVATVVPQLLEFVRAQQLSYGRSQELESDACSVAWLRGIGTDPISAWTAYRATLAATDTGPTSYAATHPSTPEREDRFKKKVSGNATSSTRRSSAQNPAATRERAARP